MDKSVFKKDYSYYYDIFYQNKDYSHEVKIINQIIKSYNRKFLTILDLACGTGKHAELLARLGFSVQGLDISGEMIDLAKKRIKKTGIPMDFHIGDIKNFSIDKPVDVVTLLFNSINYLLKKDEITNCLKNVYRSLKPSGIFICEFWHGAPTLTGYSPLVVKEYKNKDVKGLRISKTKIDLLKNQLEITFDGLITKNKKVIGDFHEEHTIRYFFVPEVLEWLKEAGFKKVDLKVAYDMNEKVTDLTWHILAIAVR